jgi:hypothetical protein
LGIYRFVDCGGSAAGPLPSLAYFHYAGGTMKKLRLNLDEVKIDSFETGGTPMSGRGTVRGRQECEDGGVLMPADDLGGCNCSCRCCCCSCANCCKCGCGGC